jgi:hypothetical protein
MEAISSSETSVYTNGATSQKTVHAGSSLVDFSNLKMEAIRSSEMSIYTISTWRHIPEDDILHSPRHENLKPYKKLTHCKSSLPS